MLENIELFDNSLGVGTYPDGQGKSFLQNIFDMVHPVGEVYIQYPQQKAPAELYNKKDGDRIIIDSTWEEQLQYNSAFFRSEHLVGGYVYKVDGETQYYIIDTSVSPRVATPIEINANTEITIAGTSSGTPVQIGSKTYKAYAVTGVNSSANDYIKETNSLTKQGNQNQYHRHSMEHTHSGNTGYGLNSSGNRNDTSSTESQGHVHYLSSGDGVIGGWQSTSSGYTGGAGSWSFSIRYADYGGGDEDLLVLSNISNISIESISGSNKTRVARSSEGSKASNTRSISRADHTHGVAFYNGSYTTGCHQSHTHTYQHYHSFDTGGASVSDTTYDGSSTDTESRPDNFTYKIWKRIA